MVTCEILLGTLEVGFNDIGVISFANVPRWFNQEADLTKLAHCQRVICILFKTIIVPRLCEPHYHSNTRSYLDYM